MVDIRGIIKAKKLTKTETKLPTHMKTANYLIHEFKDEHSRAWYELIGKTVKPTVVRTILAKAKHGNDPKRLFTKLIRDVIKA